MRAVLQRVKHAKVEVANKTVGKIGPGFLVLLGVGAADVPSGKSNDPLALKASAWLRRKILNLRVFEDDDGKMNRAIHEVPGAGLLIVSQFTLYADSRKGNRPSFVQAAPPALAEVLYTDFVAHLRLEFTGPVATGRFGADMQVTLQNDGPVTISLDTAEANF
jgi:D-tyrosyl-tRNA(Tyr) deacylase